MSTFTLYKSGNTIAISGGTGYGYTLPTADQPIKTTTLPGWKLVNEPPTPEQIDIYSQWVLEQRKLAWEGKNSHSPRSFSYRVGGDPEFFITNKQNRMVPSFAALGIEPTSKMIYDAQGDSTGILKQRPYVRLGERESWFYQDGYQLEVGYTPANCMSWNADALHQCYKAIKRMMEAKDLTLSSYTAKMVGPVTEKKYGVIELGCRPALNAYGEDTTVDDNNPPFRFTGGHFHFGWDNYAYHIGSVDTATDQELFDIYNYNINLQRLGADWINTHINPIVKAMDVYVGLLSLALGGELEHPKRRRFKYGRAGDYRLTAMTLEYRTPASPVWFHPVSWHLMGMVGRKLIQRGQAGQILDAAKYADEARAIINATDYAEARKFIFKNNLQERMFNLMGLYDPGSLQTKFSRLLNQGIANTWGDDISKNWRLGNDDRWDTHSESRNCNFSNCIVPTV